MQASTSDSNETPRSSVPQVPPKRATGAVDTTSLPRSIWDGVTFIRCTAAGTGDVLYVNTREILAIEVRSENASVVVVLKDGKAIPVSDDYRSIIGSLNAVEVSEQHG